MLSQNTLVDGLAITTAISASVQNVFSGLYGMKELSVEANFVYGSAGTTTKVWIQTSLDGGSNWIDIANFAFLLTSARKVTTLAIATAAETVTPVDGSLGDDLEVDGILGDMIRAKLTTVGTYAGDTTLDVNFVPQG
ncbi:hypothetical protein LCGC14_1332170 [marine sediment metagenome]|uniref:Uncharacterized protein n=1 Tax=marine sediment metagenome TaxID=412755 RepID=A0A0F9KGX9_9ZZZZ